MLGRGQVVPVVYRLGRSAASGVLTLTPPAARPEVFVLRRGAAVCVDGELGKRGVVARLARVAAEPRLAGTFDGRVAAYPPGAPDQIALAGWARDHLEGQLDAALAQVVVRDLADRRICVRTGQGPEPRDDADHRMLAAMARPRSLEQIWSLARAPRFRLLALVHFLGAIDALEVDRPAAEPLGAARGRDLHCTAARRLLGVDEGASLDEVKRAYRRLARALHPDLQPNADAERRRMLERRFAEVTAAYQVLT